MTTRTDIHRPSQIVPAEYRELFPYAHATSADGWPIPGFNISLLVAQRLGRPFYAASDAEKGERAPIADEQGKPYPMAKIHKGGPCDSCGAHHVYGSVFLHEPTGECVALGWQCAAKMELHMDRSAQRLIRSGRKDARLKAMRAQERREELRAFVRAASPELLKALRADHPITRDIRAKLIQWGSLTEKQEALVLKLAKQAEERAAETLTDVPEGKQIIRGTLQSRKVKSYGYGQTRHVMTVRVDTDAGTFRVWGTVPSSLMDAEAGTVIEFTATVEKSDRQGFGFFKRPTAAVVVG